MKKKKVYVVPHSHWDREWYFTIEDSNLLLVENMDRLMDVLEQDEEYKGYIFDAQSSILDEYLKIRPEEKERLSRLITDKRIFVGPWYTQADSLLIHKESLIRNLLYGTRIAEKMGHSMNVGYLPDIFGQNQYLPSIFKQFDIDYSILQRGVYTDQLKGNLNFHWSSPDGESIKANNIYFGYGPGKFLSDDEDYQKERLLPILDRLSKMNQDSDALLLPAGGDQVLVREHFPKTVKALNEQDGVYEYVLSDYETFMQDAWEEESRFTNRIDGELIASQKSRIHNTIRSQRYDIKKLNDDAEDKLIHQLEPLASLASVLGFRYPQAWMDEMWKMMFDVHAHDSIGGCNSDDTNQQIVNRLKKVIRMADGCLNLLKKQITEAVSKRIGKDSIYVAFHFLPEPYQGQHTAILFTKEKEFMVLDETGHSVSFDLLKQDYISGGKTIVVTAEGEKEVEAPGYYRNEVLLHDVSLPAMGYSAFEIQRAEENSSLIASTKDQTIENDILQVTVENGTVNVLNKKTGQHLSDMIRFEDTADAGDSYDYSPLEGDAPIYSGELELVSVKKGARSEEMEMAHKLLLPAGMEERKQRKMTEPLLISTRLSLVEGEPFVRITHHIDNSVCDHRVRVLLKTPVEQPEVSFADQGFGLIERPTINPYFENWRENGFAEAPVPIYPLENLAGTTKGGHTAAIFSKGIKEYQLLKESGELALTLYRSVGLLGRDHLAWRPGRASGINNKVVLTPDAQMKENMQFDYAYYVSGPLQETELFQRADQFRGHQAGYQKQSLNTFEERLDRFEIPYPVNELPQRFSLVENSNPHVHFSALKKAHDGRSLILRLFNPTHQPQTFTLTGEELKDCSIVQLNEKHPMELQDQGMVIQPLGYVSVKMEMQGGHSK
ncbi:glycoside hydrolase family 38 C-terminal domain-containing protein [Fictibacillus enclensis]|uniref:glycoside hydrolase family 38 N-terminal domain-containing protein n=1 Tax=Fictibacillus enclensis TaxID=1017270 RepID=UPI0024BF7658|nr:glycoside hydrolase family 38 C-terminal domain-containing protein [Fictibacillus enclensis]WHY72297.1 glycoside hydrolase family 38 C-terminal domain-containing protein [Fictibacillus enclensis]